MDILSLLKDYHVSYTLSGKNVGKGWVGVCCPYCNDVSFHGGFPLNGKGYTCFRCGKHPMKETLKLLLDIPYDQLNRILEDYDYTNEIKTKEPLPNKTLELVGERPLNKYARKYLESRKFDPDYLELKYKLLSTNEVGEWKYRIIFPIFDKDKIVSFQGRDYTGKQTLRYYTLSAEKSLINPKHLLYNEQFIKGDKIGVCEGIFDAIRLGDGFVALLGMQFTNAQLQKLLHYNHISIIFDPEPLAQQKAIELAEKLASFGKDVAVINTELDHDPGDMTPKEVSMLRKALLL